MTRSAACRLCVRRFCAVLTCLAALAINGASGCGKSPPGGAEAATVGAAETAAGRAAAAGNTPGVAGTAPGAENVAAPAGERTAAATAPEQAAEQLAARPCWNGSKWVERPAAFAAPEDARCGQVGGKPLQATPVGVLGDRLTLRPPEGARLLGRPAGIMGAAAPAEVESRVFYEDGGEKFVIMAWELLQTAGDRLAAGVIKMYEDSGATGDVLWCAEPLALGDPRLQAYAVAPSKVGGGGEANPVLTVVTSHPDGLAQLLRFYVNPALVPDGPGCTELARRIARTLMPGTRAIDRRGGPHRLPAWGRTQELQITLPADYLLTPQEGPDFKVYRVQPIVPLDGASGSLGIYLGDHPQAPPGDWSGPVQRVRSPFLGREVEWVGWDVPQTAEKPAEHHLEVLVPMNEYPGFPAFLHVFISAGTTELLLDLKEVARSLAVVPSAHR